MNKQAGRLTLTTHHFNQSTMKRLLLLFLFSGSLDGFSQVQATTLPGDGSGFLNRSCDHKLTNCKCMKLGTLTERIDTVHIGKQKLVFKNDTLYKILEDVVKPDTLRAICLVTLFPNGIAHARMGFVVICEGKEVEYLDCRKRALKLPQVGWRYRLIDPNEKVR